MKISTYKPVKNSNGKVNAVIGVDIWADKLFAFEEIPYTFNLIMSGNHADASLISSAMFSGHDANPMDKTVGISNCNYDDSLNATIMNIVITGPLSANSVYFRIVMAMTNLNNVTKGNLHLAVTHGPGLAAEIA